MKTTDLITEQEFTQIPPETIIDKFAEILKGHSKEYFDKFKKPSDIFFQINPLLENAKLYLYQIDLFLQEVSDGKYHTLQHLIYLAAKPLRDTIIRLLKIDNNFGNRNAKTVSKYSVPVRFIYEQAFINEHFNAKSCLVATEYYLLRYLNNYTDDITDSVKQEIESILGDS